MNVNSDEQNERRLWEIDDHEQRETRQPYAETANFID